MVQPLSFGFDEQTAATNSFQIESALAPSEILKQANDEFDAMVAGLRAHDVSVHVYQDADRTSKPNAVFPNNWFSTWQDGNIYLYPMATASRRQERNGDAIDELRQQFTVTQVDDLSVVETKGKYLESTGVMVFDHLHKVVYGCISERCDERLFTDHAKTLGYRPIAFHAYDPEGAPIYHTNVMMGIQTETVVICAESITDESERLLVLTCLKATGRTIVEITYAQMVAFCGNVLELQGEDSTRYLAMSQSAYDSFTANQQKTLAKDKTILPFSIPMIEKVGGGSVRCMIAEIFLPRVVARPVIELAVPIADVLK